MKTKIGIAMDKVALVNMARPDYFSVPNPIKQPDKPHPGNHILELHEIKDLPKFSELSIRQTNLDTKAEVLHFGMLMSFTNGIANIKTTKGKMIHCMNVDPYVWEFVRIQETLERLRDSKLI